MLTPPLRHIPQVFARPLSRGRLAVLLLDRASTKARLAAPWAALGIAAGVRVLVHDVISQAERGGAADAFEADVPSHDVAFVVLRPEAGAPPLHRQDEGETSR